VGDICVGRGPDHKSIFKTVGMGKLWKMRESAQEFQRIVEALFEYAISFEFYHKPNPATRTRLGLKETLHQVGHRKPVSLQNLPLVIDALLTYRYSHYFHKLQKAGVRPPVVMAIEFSARAGGVRMGEVRQAQWKEIDLERKLWTVPAKHRKLKLKYKLNPRYTHEVPLAPGMIAVLDQVKADGYDTSPEAPIFASMSRSGIFDASVISNFIRKHLQPYIRKVYGVDIVFHAHGFRSSLRDWWRANEYSAALWKLQVGQRPGSRDDLDERAAVKGESNKTDNAYGHEQLTEKRRPYMIEWDKLCSSYTPTPASKVADISNYRKRRRAA
jgi:integrase